MKEDRPLRDVVSKQLRSGRGGLLGPDTSRRLRWWYLTLTCGHSVERTAKYTRRTDPYLHRSARPATDLLPAPKRARCDDETCHQA